MNADPAAKAETINPAIRCSDCAAVCCRLTVLLMPGDVIPAWLTEHDEHGLEHMAQHEDGWCVAVDRMSMRCTIYGSRPQLCRSVPMGGRECRDERDAWYGKSADAIPITLITEPRQPPSP
jgi:Fe-S-cluster containining protein